jgi:hypothetical protein
MQDLLIAGNIIKPGTTASLNIPIANLPIRTPVTLSVSVYRSLNPGPTVLLMGGIHGDELTGVEAVRRMIAGNLLRPEAGTIIAVPVVNLFGFLHRSREFPDGRDLNRSFPGSKDGPLASQVAYVIMHEIMPHVDVAIDFHSGSGRRYNVPQIRCHIENPKELELARVFGAKYTLYSNYREKSFREKSSKMGKTILVYEGGEALRFEEEPIQAAIDGTKRVLDYLGVHAQEAQNQMPLSITLRSSKWIRAKVSGLFRSYLEHGEAVVRGQVIGSISDPYGEREVVVKAAYSGFIIGFTRLPLVNKGDALFHIGFAKAS